MDTVQTWKKDDFHITTDKSQFDIDAIYQYLTRSTWSKGIDKQTVKESIESSLCFGLFYKEKQIGFTRVITDGCTFGYLCDVYVLEQWQKKKLGSWLIECCHEHATMQRLRRIVLVTSTVPWLYKKHQYTPVNQKDFVWQIFRPDIYAKKTV